MTLHKTPSRQGLAGDRIRMKYALRWSALALVASLAACGGGNGSEEVELTTSEGVVATHNPSNAKTDPRVQE